MRDESLQLVVNSIQHFLSSHHYLHSLSAPKARSLPDSCCIHPWWEYERPCCEQSVKTSVLSPPPPSIKQCGRPLMCLLAPEVAAMDVRSHKLKCHPLSLNPQVKKWDAGEEMKHLWCFDLQPHAGMILPRPSAWFSSAPLGVPSQDEPLIEFLLCYLHDSAGSSKWIQNSCLPVKRTKTHQPGELGWH